jgi:probable HAF family extracellular repeat protein
MIKARQIRFLTSQIQALMWGATLVALAPSLRAAVSFSITDLGTLGGATSSAAGINNLGDVVGTSDTTGHDAVQPLTPLGHAFLYHNGVMTDVDGSLRQSNGAAINDNGQIVGYNQFANGYVGLPVKTINGTFTNLPTFGFDGFASSINNNGDIAATLDTTRFYLDHAVIYHGNQIQDINGSSSNSISRSINDVGQVAGDAGGQAFLYSNGSMHLLGLLPGFSSTYAKSVNNVGQVVGYAENFNFSNFTATDRAVLFDTDNLGNVTQRVDIGTLGGANSVAAGINLGGWIVGNSTTTLGAQHAFLYSSNEMTDLNSLIPNSGWTLTAANGVNGAGQIVGSGTNSKGQAHAFLLTPNISTHPSVEPPAPTSTPILSEFPSPVHLYQELPQFMADHGNEFSASSVAFINSNTAKIQPLIDSSGDRFLKDFAGSLGDNLKLAGDASGYIKAAASGDLAAAELQVIVTQAHIPAVSLAFTVSNFARQIATKATVGALWTANNYIWGNLVAGQLQRFGEDPPSPDYMDVVQSTDIPNLSPSMTTTGFSQLDAARDTQVVAGLKVAAYLQAANDSYDRYSGAIAAGNTTAAGLQLEALLQYLNLYNDSARAAATDLQSTRDLAISLGMADQAFDPLAFQSLQTKMAGGLEPDVIQFLSDQGLSTSDIDTLRLSAISLDPLTISGSEYGLAGQASAIYLQASVPEPSTVMPFIIIAAFARIAFRKQRFILTSDKVVAEISSTRTTMVK